MGCQPPHLAPDQALKQVITCNALVLCRDLESGGSGALCEQMCWQGKS